MSSVNSSAGAGSKTDATRAELERAATVQRGAQEHHGDLLLRHTAAIEALRAAKRARKIAKAELARSEKAVDAGQAAAESLGEQVKLANKLVARTRADVNVAERRHTQLLTKQAERQEKKAAAVARRGAEQARADARRTRRQTLRDAEERARSEERNVRDEADRRAADQVAKAEQDAERTRRAGVQQAATLAGGGTTPVTVAQTRRPTQKTAVSTRTTRGSSRSSTGMRST